jgi:16S rRNA G966 N2-methylase RsmD
VFVDQSEEAVRLLRSNIVLCGAEDRTRVLTGRVSQVLLRLAERGDTFDLVFMDPPYGVGWIEKTIPLLRGLAHSETMIVAEHHHKDRIASQIAEWRKLKERRYGDSVISFFEQVSTNEEAENSNPERERN